MIEKCILLLLASNAVDSVDPRAADEIREIDGVIRSAAHRDSFEPLQRSALRDSDITEVLNRYQPHILHISGHAKPIEGLVLEDDNRKVAKIGCPELVNLILSPQMTVGSVSSFFPSVIQKPAPRQFRRRCRMQ